MELKIRWYWLIFFIGTGICYIIIQAQEMALKN
jgi:hypothetical protein